MFLIGSENRSLFHMAGFQARIDNGAEFAYLIGFVLPGASAREVQRLFGPKADLRLIASWKKGERWPPDWVMGVLRSAAEAKIARAQTAIARVRSGPGRKGHRATLRQFRQTG